MLNHDANTSPVEVYRAASSVDAHAMRTLLEAGGVEAQVVGDTVEAAGLGVGQSYTTVVVHSNDATRARELVARAEAQAQANKSLQTRPIRYNVRYLLVAMTLVAIVAAIFGKLPVGVWGTVLLTLLFLGEIAEIFASFYRAIDEA